MSAKPQNLIELGALTTKVGSGSTPRGGSKAYKPSGIPLIRSQNVLSGRMALEDVAYIDSEQHDKMNRSKVDRGDVLLNITGASIGRAALSCLDSANVNQHVCIIRCNDQLDHEYLMFFLNSSHGQKQINRLQSGGNREGLNFQQIRSFKIPTPSIDEQRRIAGILSTWEKAINTYDRLIALKEKQKRGLMQCIFSSLEGKEVAVSDILEESRVPSESPDVAKRITVRLNLGGVENRKVTSESKSATKQFQRRAGQFIYGKQNIHKGSFGIIPKELDGFESSQDLPAFDFTGICNSLWFYYFMSREAFYTGFENLMSGTGSKRLSPQVFLSQKVVLPDTEQQEHIANILLNIDGLIKNLTKKRDLLKKQKQGLMQKLLA